MKQLKNYSKQFLNLGWKLEQLAHGLKGKKDLKTTLWNLSKEIFNFVLEREPNNINALQGLGTLFLHQQKYQQAETYYQRALQFAKTLEQKARFYNSLENVHFQKKNYQQALTLYQKALPHLRYKALVLANLAFTYQALNQGGLAKKYAQKALEALEKEKDLKHSSEPARSLKKLTQTKT